MCRKVRIGGAGGRRKCQTVSYPAENSLLSFQMCPESGDGSRTFRKRHDETTLSGRLASQYASSQATENAIIRNVAVAEM